MGTRLDPRVTHLAGQNTTRRPSADFQDAAVTSLNHRDSLSLMGLVVQCPVARVTRAAVVHFPWPLNTDRPRHTAIAREISGEKRVHRCRGPVPTDRGKELTGERKTRVRCTQPGLAKDDR
ncbi:hypothetical protein MRX96_054533 [Rhipicephalus microplus]